MPANTARNNSPDSLTPSSNVKTLKSILTNVVFGANVVAVLIMVAVGYSDVVPPDVSAYAACAGLIFPLTCILNLVFILLWLFIHWQRMWLSVLGFLCTYGPIHNYMPLHLEADVPEEGVLKVMTYNVCGYTADSDYPMERFDTIRDYIAAQQPDIVCLQEDNSQPKKGPKSFSSVFAYNDTTHVSNNNRGMVNMVGLHTRFPIIRKERIRYKSDANGSVAYFLRLDSGDTLIVVNNHLETTHLNQKERSRYKDMLRGQMTRDTVEAETRHLVNKLGAAMVLRAPQAQAVSRWVRLHADRYPVIVCGDFNDTPISYTHRTVGRGLTDCFVETGRGLGLTYNQKGFNLRIDHIFCSDQLKPINTVVDSKFACSDHYPVISWLKISDNH